MQRIKTIIVQLVLASLVGALFVLNPRPVVAQSAEALVARGDSLLVAFDHAASAQAYRAAVHVDTNHCKALWRLAETHVNLGEEAEDPVRRQHYYVAEQWAREALARCPQTPNAHFFVAVTSGLLALYEGPKQKIRRSREVLQHLKTTLELDSTHHGAHHALGRWHRELAKLSWIEKTVAKIVYGGVPPGASYEAAVAHFKKAIELAPRRIDHHKELGITYATMEAWALARESFQRCLELPVADHLDPRHKAECRRWLERLKGR